MGVVIEMDCEICGFIEAIKGNKLDGFVIELVTGYVMLSRFLWAGMGYTVFICKEHLPELHMLQEDFKMKFLSEMAFVAEAAFNVFKPEKLNYELLGNSEPHMHWHIVPRVSGDTPERGPIWTLPKSVLYDEKNIPAPERMRKMTSALKSEILRLVELKK